MFTAKLQDSRSTSNHVRGLCNPMWTHTPWTPPPLGAAPNRLPPELAPCERTWVYAASASIYLSMWLKPDTLQTKSVVEVCWAGKTFTAKLQDSRSTSNHVRGLYNPTWTHTPWTPPPLGAAPNRLLPELAPHRTIEAIKIQKNPCKQNVKHVFYKYIRLGRCSLPNFKIRYRQAIMSEGFTTPREHTLPGPLLRLGLPQTGCYQSWLLTGP